MQSHLMNSWNLCHSDTVLHCFDGSIVPNIEPFQGILRHWSDLSRHFHGKKNGPDVENSLGIPQNQDNLWFFSVQLQSKID